MSLGLKLCDTRVYEPQIRARLGVLYPLFRRGPVLVLLCLVSLEHQRRVFQPSSYHFLTRETEGNTGFVGATGPSHLRVQDSGLGV